MDKEAWLTQLKRGLLELYVLNLLEHQTMHGYELIKRVSEMDGFVVTEGTIYPLISRMKHDGLLKTTFVESPSGPVRKMYQLSAAGRECRADMNRLWMKISASVIRTINGRNREP